MTLQIVRVRLSGTPTYLPVFAFYLAMRNPLVLTRRQHGVREKGTLKWKDIVSPNTRRNNKETQRMRQPPTTPHPQHPSFPHITEVNEMCEEEFRILLLKRADDLIDGLSQQVSQVRKSTCAG